MDPQPLALLLSRVSVLNEANSARPWAPVVEPRAPRPHHTRAAMATALHRVADALAPAPARDVFLPAH